MIKNFTIYGERCSGTKYLTRIVQSYYNLPVTWDFGWKHFFGFDDQNIKTLGQNTLFIGIVRNPYEWLMSLRKIPHHLKDTKDDTFFSSIIESTYKGQLIIKDRNFLTNSNPENAKPYNNIFELRSVKTNYLYHTVPHIAKNYYFVTYEKLIEQPQIILDQIAKKFALNTTGIFEPARKPIGYDIVNLKLINENIEWTIENAVGYYQKF